jgi:uncharacterized SAM-binding protein YcdF (DUF218 family)
VFFLLSKTLGRLLLPSNLLVSLGVVGLILLLTRFASTGRKLVAASSLLLAVCGFLPIGNLLLYPLETRFPPWDNSRGPPDGIVVLGGAIDPDMSALHGAPVFGPSVDRIIATTDLAHRYPNARIVISGGNADLDPGNQAREADFTLPVLESFGVTRDRLIIERRSRNTQENAEFSRIVAAPKRGELWLLVTSAYHMPRAIGIFRKVGFTVEPYPVDWRVGGRDDLLKFSVSFIGGLGRVDTAAREWMGLTAYWITGKTIEFFPNPNPGER